MKKLILVLVGMTAFVQVASAACIYGKIVPVQEEGNFLVDARNSANIIGAVVSDLSDLTMNKDAYYEYTYVDSHDENEVLVTVKKVSSCREE